MSDTQLVCWPKFMPKPQRSGYSYEPTDRRVKTEMEIGSLNRVEYTTDETVIQCTMTMCNVQQLEFFEAFERDCLNQGTKWFIMPIWINGKLEEYKCRFRARPKFATNNTVTHTTVTMQVEIEERDLIDPDITDALLHYEPADIAHMINAYESLLARFSAIPPDTWEWWSEFAVGMNQSINMLGGCTNGPAELQEVA